MDDSEVLNYSEPAASLLRIGKPGEPWPDYPKLYGLTTGDVQELTRMAVDEHAWQEDEEDTAVYRNVHAWRALAQLGAVEAAPTLVEAFRWVDQYDDDWTAEDLPEAFGLLGPQTIPTLREYLLDENHGLWARVAASAALEEIGKRHPEAKEECAAVIAQALENYKKNDGTLNSCLVADLADLQVPETYPVVEQAFAHDQVDLMMMGDWEDFQVAVGLLKERQTPLYKMDMESDVPPREFIEEIVQRVQSREKEKKEKNKRKQEKQSRKKNKKKK